MIKSVNIYELSIQQAYEKAVNSNSTILNHSQIEYDISLLYYAFQKAYSGYKYIPEAEKIFVEKSLAALS